jgi:hypothetical protein
MIQIHIMLCYLNGAPGEIRTPDHLVRSQVLYPTELRARGKTIVGGLTKSSLSAESRSGIIQVLGSDVNTICKFF